MYADCGVVIGVVCTEATAVCLQGTVALCCGGIEKVLTHSDADRSFWSLEAAKSFNSSNLVLAVEVTVGD